MKSLNIPKQHSLRHYIRLVGELYGESKSFLDEYIEDQVEANKENLDGAIDCFVELGKQAINLTSVKKENKVDNIEEENIKKQSRNCPIGQNRLNFNGEQRSWVTG